MHISRIFKEEELDKNSVVKFFLTTAIDGKTYNTKHYNLDMIVSIGANLKDLGNKVFAFSKFEIGTFGILERLK